MTNAYNDTTEESESDVGKENCITKEECIW